MYINVINGSRHEYNVYLSQTDLFLLFTVQCGNFVNQTAENTQDFIRFMYTAKTNNFKCICI